jgi:hypothetical protein
MRKTMAAMATVALASVLFGGTALAGGEEGGNANTCSGSGNNNGNTSGFGFLGLLNGVGIANGNLNGNFSPVFCD